MPNFGEISHFLMPPPLWNLWSEIPEWILRARPGKKFRGLPTYRYVERP